MLVSTKGRYALRVMVDLAEHQAAGRIPLKEIAARQGISEKYLENILATLVRANMLSGMRGKGGGYVLTRPPEQYTVGLDGDCKGCSRSDECPTLGVWKNLDKLINDYLDGVTLDALVAPNEGYDYVI
mgnify:CR=1 FL=1